MKEQFLQMRPGVELEFDNGFRVVVNRGYATISHKDNQRVCVRVDVDGLIEATWSKSECTGLTRMADYYFQKLDTILPAGTLLTKDLYKKKVIGLTIPPQKE